MQALNIKQYKHRRRHPRHAVEWPCRLHLGKQSIINGTVRDRSEGGLCFEPEVAWVDGEFSLGRDSLHMLEDGEAVQAVYVTPWPKSQECRVRWRGRSITHDRNVVGLEFIL